MFNSQFYPTPKEVIDIMYKKMSELFNYDKFLLDEGYNWVTSKVILEPSAGKGDILKYLMEKDNEYYGTRYNRTRFLACEIEPDLRSILSSMENVDLVGADFLNDFLPIFPNAIIMNPPFDMGAKHFLRAYEMLSDGCMVCLLNAATVDNPNTFEKKKLLEIVEQQKGEIVRLGNCFAGSERHTNVEVVMVALKKEEERSFDFEDNFENENYEERHEFDNCTNQIEFSNLFSQREALYKSAIDSFITAKKAFEDFKSKLAKVAYDKDHLSDLDQTLERMIDKLNHSSWQKILDESKFDQYLSTSVKKNFLEHGFKRQQKIAFNQNNMWELFSVLIQNQSDIMNSCIVEVFDYLTKYHEDNREHIEGWKTNDYYQVKSKFILPHLVKYEDYFGWGMGYNDHRSSYTDIDKILAYLTGQKIENIITIRQGLKDTFAEIKKTGVKTKHSESTFFTLMFHKKGTVHFTWKDESLRQYFNIRASELKGFPLPKGKTNYQDMRKYKGGNDFLNRIG